MIYVDPGAGALIWQLVLALFFGVMFSFSKFKGWAGNNFRTRLRDAEASKPVAPAKSSSEAK